MIQRVVEREGGALQTYWNRVQMRWMYRLTLTRVCLCAGNVYRSENVFFQLMEDCWPWTIVLPAQKNDIFPERTWSDTGSTLSPNTLFSWFLVSLNIVPDSMERLSIVQPLYMAFVWKFKKWTRKHGSRDSFTLWWCSTLGELMDW